MNYVKTLAAVLMIAIVTMGFAAAGSTQVTYVGTGSYDMSWSGTGGEITINTHTPEGSDTFYSNFESGSSSGYQSMDRSNSCTVIYRDVSITDGYSTTHTESISGMFEDRSYTSDFRQFAAYTQRVVRVYDWR